MSRLKRVLVGVSTDPQVVAAVRALVLYLVPVVAELVIAWLAGITDPRWLPVIPATVTAIRVLEGAVDRALKGPGINDVPPTTEPTPPAGAGAPVDHISADK